MGIQYLEPVVLFHRAMMSLALPSHGPCKGKWYQGGFDSDECDASPRGRARAGHSP